MVLEGVTINKLRQSFKVLSVNSRTANIARYNRASTTIRIVQQDDEPTTAEAQPGGDLVVTGVPGLANQVKELNAFLKAFGRPFWVEGERKSCAILLHGGHGTGKTFILQRLADTNWGKAHWIRPSDKLATIRETFKQARSQKPSLVFLEDLERLIAKDRSNRDSVIEAIGDELDSLSAQADAENALPLVVVVATCSDYMTDVPGELQKGSRFEESIALPIPRAAERLEILKFFDPPLKEDEKEQALLSLSQRTHAYNAGDLGKLVRRAKKIVGHRLDNSDVDTTSGQKHFLSKEELELAFRITQPTAMHDVNLQPPTIHWQDVGGQESLKKALSRMIKNTKVHPPLPCIP